MTGSKTRSVGTNAGQSDSIDGPKAIDGLMFQLCCLGLRRLAILITISASSRECRTEVQLAIPHTPFLIAPDVIALRQET